MNNIADNKRKLRSLLAISLLALTFILFQPDHTLAQSGTPDQVTKWLTSSTFGNSTITDKAGNIGISIINPANFFHAAPIQYSTGTASQATTTITGSGTTFTQAMVGSLLVFADGTRRTITGFTNATTLTVAETGTVADQTYTINYVGFSINSTGKVGIGTIAPVANLQVHGVNSVITAGHGIISAVDTTPLAADVGAGISLRGVYKADGSTGGFGGIKAGKSNATDSNLDSYLALFSRNNSGGILERMRIDKDGKVGIGTTAPGANLHISSTQAAGGTTLLVESTNGLTNEAGTIDLKGQGEVLTRIQGDYFLGTSISTRLTQNALRISDPGKLGIKTGTTVPATRLQLGIDNPTTAEDGIQFGADSSANLYRSGAGTLKTNGTLNVGTAIQINGVSITSGGLPNVAYLNQPNTFTGINTFSTSITTPVVASAAALALNPAANSNLNVTVTGTGNFAVNTSQLVATSGGNVGIGTTTPTAKLDVAGNTNVTGNFNATGTITGGTINAKYQDIAEWVPSRQAMTNGTVVVLDPERSNHVITSKQTYDTTVAGIVSDTPGVILGEAGEGKLKIATTGRVKVKVDATKAPIRVGDLLVTSAEEGVAMRSEPLEVAGTKIHRPGTIIGKALEPLAKGKGEILVLLSMQ